MSEPGQPPPTNLGEVSSARPRKSDIDELYSAKMPDFENPFSADVHRWLNAVGKATKAIRVYERNNRMFRNFIDSAHGQLTALAASDASLTLNVREDRLLYGADPVHINPDRQEGIPFILYRNALRRITFDAGMEREELISFLTALTTDFSSFDHAGEDLVTVLWRLKLPHLRYFAIDALSVAVDPGTESGRKEQQAIDALQTNIDDLVAAIYGASAQDDDFVRGVAITKEDLEALKEIREESEEDLELLDVATARAVTAIEADALATVQLERKEESHDSLLSRLFELVVGVLFKEDSGDGFGQTIELIQNIFDALLLAQRYGDARRVVEQLREQEKDVEDLKALHVTKHLLRVFSMQSRITPVVTSLGDSVHGEQTREALALLRALGQHVQPTLLNLIDVVESPAFRRTMCEVIVELGPLDAAVLGEKMENAKSFVMGDLMAMAARMPQKDLAPLLLTALQDPYPKVRAQAIGMLRSFPRGAADELLTKAFSDDEVEVRLRAYRVAAARKSTAGKSTLKVMLLQDDVHDRAPRELRTMTTAYASIAGADAHGVLNRLLNPGFFARSFMTEGQVAAAYALGMVGTDEAKKSLSKGSRTVNKRVREACKEAATEEAQAKNTKSYLGGDMIDLLADFVGPKDGEADPLRVALDNKRKQRLSEAPAPAVRPSKPPETLQSEWEKRRDETQELGLSGVRKPHNAPDQMPESLLSASKTPASSAESPFGPRPTDPPSPFGAPGSGNDNPAIPAPPPPAAGSGPLTSTAATPDASPFGGGAPDASPFGGGAPDASPFGGGAPDASPFGGGAPDASPFGGGAPDASPFGGGAPDASPFGGGAPEPGGGGAPEPAPFGGGTPASGPFAGATPVPAPLDAPAAPSPFGGAPAPFGGAASEPSAGGEPAATPFGRALPEPTHQTHGTGPLPFARQPDPHSMPPDPRSMPPPPPPAIGTGPIGPGRPAMPEPPPPAPGTGPNRQPPHKPPIRAGPVPMPAPPRGQSGAQQPGYPQSMPPAPAYGGGQPGYAAPPASMPPRPASGLHPSPPRGPSYSQPPGYAPSMPPSPAHLAADLHAPGPAAPPPPRAGSMPGRGVSAPGWPPQEPKPAWSVPPGPAPAPAWAPDRRPPPPWAPQVADNMPPPGPPALRSEPPHPAPARGAPPRTPAHGPPAHRPPPPAHAAPPRPPTNVAPPRPPANAPSPAHVAPPRPPANVPSPVNLPRPPANVPPPRPTANVPPPAHVAPPRPPANVAPPRAPANAPPPPPPANVAPPPPANVAPPPQASPQPSWPMQSPPSTPPPAAETAPMRAIPPAKPEPENAEGIGRHSMAPAERTAMPSWPPSNNAAPPAAPAAEPAAAEPSATQPAPGDPLADLLRDFSDGGDK